MVKIRLWRIYYILSQCNPKEKNGLPITKHNAKNEIGSQGDDFHIYSYFFTFTYYLINKLDVTVEVSDKS